MVGGGRRTGSGIRLSGAKSGFRIQEVKEHAPGAGSVFGIWEVKEQALGASAGFSIRESGAGRQMNISHCRGQAEFSVLFKSLQGMPPAESWETAVVTVRGYPLAARFDSQGCQISIGDKIAFDACRPAKPCEDLPMPSARSYDDAIGLVTQFGGKAKRVFPSGRQLEDSRMGHNADESGCILVLRHGTGARASERHGHQRR